MLEKNKLVERGISSFTLHILAMVIMLGDHIWGTTGIQTLWLTTIGRMAFPIFAFLLVEGFYHTHDRKKYIKRILLFAVISEVPFDWMYNGFVFYPFHQNVLWNFGISLVCLQLMESIRAEENWIKTYLSMPVIILLGYIVATITFTDYHGAGILTVMVFYLCRGNSKINRFMQFIGLVYINCFILKGLCFTVTIGSFSWDIPYQGFAILSLIPIWLYKGRQGPYNRVIKEIYYWFYPVHAFILGLITTLSYVLS